MISIAAITGGGRRPPGLFDNYATVLLDSRLPQFVLNSFLVAIPAVIGTIVFASMAGVRAREARVQGQQGPADDVHRRQPRPLPGADDPGARPRDRARGSTIRAGR
jgi:hypothetical protein